MPKQANGAKNEPETAGPDTNLADGNDVAHENNGDHDNAEKIDVPENGDAPQGSDSPNAAPSKTNTPAKKLKQSGGGTKDAGNKSKAAKGTNHSMNQSHLDDDGDKEGRNTLSDIKMNVFASYKEIWLQQTKLRKLEAEAKIAEAKARNAAETAEQMKCRREEADRMKREMELVMQTRMDNSAELRESVKQMAAALHENAARNREDLQNRNREEAANYRTNLAQMVAEKKREREKRQKELIAQAKAMNSNAICDNPKTYWVNKSKEQQKKEMERLEQERQVNEEELKRLKKQEQKLMRKIEQSRQQEEEEKRKYEKYLSGEYKSNNTSFTKKSTTKPVHNKLVAKSKSDHCVESTTLDTVLENNKVDHRDLHNSAADNAGGEYNDAAFDENESSPKREPN